MASVGLLFLIIAFLTFIAGIGCVLFKSTRKRGLLLFVVSGVLCLIGYSICNGM